MQGSNSRIVNAGLVFATLCLSCATVPPKQAVEDINDTTVVATIGDVTITGGEFRTFFLSELQPDPYSHKPVTEPPKPQHVLISLLGDKAVIMEGRKQNLHQDEHIQKYVNRYKEGLLLKKLTHTFVTSQIVVTEQEIQKEMEANPALDRDGAQSNLTRRKQEALASQYTTQLMEKLNVQIKPEHFAQIAEIHERLLHHPVTPRKQSWILNSQIEDEITPSEKELVLATYEGGTFTCLDWFEALSHYSPPKRPRDLTAQGVEQLLLRSLQRPVQVAEAMRIGYDKDPEIIAEIRKVEDSAIYRFMRSNLTKDIEPPTDDDIRTYFETYKKYLGKQDTLKVDVLWCANREAAEKVKTALDKEGDFTSLKQKYSIRKETQKPSYVSATSEGIFWAQLWPAEPNDIKGPMLGFYEQGIKWRLVKIMETHHGTPATELNNNIKHRIRDIITTERYEMLWHDYKNHLLAECNYHIFTGALAYFDPRNIP